MTWNQNSQALPSLAKRVPSAGGGCFVNSDVVLWAQNTRHAKICKDLRDLFVISRATLFAKEGFGADFLRYFKFLIIHNLYKIQNTKEERIYNK